MRRKCMAIGIAMCLSVGSMSGCGAGADQSSRTEQESPNTEWEQAIKTEGQSADRKQTIEAEKQNADGAQAIEAEDQSAEKKQTIETEKQNADGAQAIEVEKQSADRKQATETEKQNADTEQAIETEKQNADTEQAIETEKQNADGAQATEAEKQSAEKEQAISAAGENGDMQNSEAAELSSIAADYEAAFQGMEGCAVFLDGKSNIYTFYHESECRTRVSPESTFKVISALIGLHNQIVSEADSRLGYDGTKYPVNAWNADLSLTEAFQSSCIWYFRKIIDEAGQDTVQSELEQLGYGNCDISEWKGSGVNAFPELNGFWLDSSLLISPAEQVEILRNIVEGKTIYTESEVEILKSVMLAESDASRTIYGKTGTGTDGTAWFLGFAEQADTTVYFAIYLDDDDADEISGAKAKEIALDILAEKS